MRTSSRPHKDASGEDRADRRAAPGPADRLPERGIGVVVHLGEGEAPKHEAVLRNIANLRADLGDRGPVELVTLGPGISACVTASPVADQVQDLIGIGVSVVACANSLAAQNIARGNLAPGVGVVPSGVGQLVRRQAQGWAYLRP